MEPIYNYYYFLSDNQHEYFIVLLVLYAESSEMCMINYKCLMGESDLFMFVFGTLTIDFNCMAFSFEIIINA